MNICFKISGEFVTRHARDLVLGSRFDESINFLVDNLDGMTHDIAILILKGENKLVGFNNNIELQDDNDTNYIKELNRRFSGCLKVNGEFYKPYARVTNYGWHDIGTKPLISSDCPKEYYRSLHYAKPGVVKVFIIEKDATLWEKVEIPFWYKDYETDFKKSYDRWVEKNGNLRITGWSQVYGQDKSNFMPQKTDDVFKENLEEVEEKLDLTPINNYESHPFGWISPDGKFYPTHYMGHRNLANSLVKFLKLNYTGWDGELYLEDSGWVKVGKTIDGDPFVFNKHHLTISQQNVLEQWKFFHMKEDLSC